MTITSWRNYQARFSRRNYAGWTAVRILLSNGEAVNDYFVGGSESSVTILLIGFVAM